MTGELTDIAVAETLAARVKKRQLADEIDLGPDPEVFKHSMGLLLNKLEVIADYRWLTMLATEVPWLDTGLTVDVNDEISFFCQGRVYANQALDIWIGPAFQVWGKIGESGEIFRGTRSHHSFRASEAGRLQLGNLFPNDWKDKQGSRRHSDRVYGAVTGEVTVLVIRWLGSANTGLKALLTKGDCDGMVRDELERIGQGDITPSGWQYLWNLGPAEIYHSSQTREGKPCISCHTHQDTGILQYAVDLPLLDTSEISWSWCVDQLPSSIREDSLLTHDYLSIAIEFDNGRDITYYWSSQLPVGRGFDCPLPNFQGKEYHVVIRSGEAGLGEWLAERRNLYQDYRDYMGEPPARIVRIWLIANSIFQREVGRCQYADIVLHQGETELRVL